MAPRRHDHDEDLEDEDVNDQELGEEDGPPSINPYTVLELETDASADDVKKAYRKLALKHHPDKAPEADKTVANKKFQEIAFAYAVLSDESRRKRYDVTGSTAETIADDDDFDWLSFYRQQWEDVVTEENIKRIAIEYKGSAEERRDLLEAYTRAKGNLDRIYGQIMLSDILEDDERFRKILDEEIEKGTIDSFKAYEKQNNDAARKKAQEKEIKRREDFDKKHGAEFEGAKAKAKSKTKKNDANDMAGLAALIQRKQAARGNFFDHLEAKYAPSPRGKKRPSPMDEPPEEMFAAAAKRGKENAKKRKTTKKVAVEDDIDESEEDIAESEDEEEEESEEEVKPKKKGRLTKGKARSRAKA